MPHAYDLTSAPRSISRRTPSRHSLEHWDADDIGRATPAPTIFAARAYDHVGDDYGSYADGDNTSGEASSTFGRYEHADAIVWQELRALLNQLRQANISNVRVLDAGCGPGTWTTRIASYAREIGLGTTVIGVDISTKQLAIARRNARSLAFSASNRRFTIEFQECDLSKPLPWADRHFDLVLCNYTVLNHLAEESLPAAVKELCRVSSGNVIATLRSLGSPPTACIIGMEHVREYHHDNVEGELVVTLDDTSRHKIPFKMYTAQSLRAMFLPYADINELRAIDIFAGRFAADGNWTAALLRGSPERRMVLEQLEQLEEKLCRRPGWIDHGTHVLIVARAANAQHRATPQV